MAEWIFGKYWRSMVHLGLIPIDLRFMKWNNVWFMFVCNWWLWLGKQNINEVSMHVGWILLSIVILEVLDVISLLGCLILNCCSNWALCLRFKFSNLMTMQVHLSYNLAVHVWLPKFCLYGHGSVGSMMYYSGSVNFAVCVLFREPISFVALVKLITHGPLFLSLGITILQVW